MELWNPIPPLGLRCHLISDWDIILSFYPERICRQEEDTIAAKKMKMKKDAVFCGITLDIHMFYAILYVDIRSVI